MEAKTRMADTGEVVTTEKMHFSFVNISIKTLEDIEIVFHQMFREAKAEMLTIHADFHDGSQNEFTVRHEEFDFDNTDAPYSSFFRYSSFENKKIRQITFYIFSFLQKERSEVRLVISEDGLFYNDGVSFEISSKNRDFIDKYSRRIEKIFKECSPIQWKWLSGFLHSKSTLSYITTYLLLSGTIFAILVIALIDFSIPVTDKRLSTISLVSLFIGLWGSVFLQAFLAAAVPSFEIGIGPEHLKKRSAVRRWIGAVCVFLVGAVVSALIAKIVP